MPIHQRKASSSSSSGKMESTPLVNKEPSAKSEKPIGAAPSVTQKALIQQGYDYTPAQLAELSWGLRFTPFVCMIGAIVGLIYRLPYLHFALAALGILPFWFPAWHPLDRFYNHVLRPMWDGVVLPPNPLPRRIACLCGGAMNILIGIAWLKESPDWAYIFGGILITLQIIVITTHFCVASWGYELILRAMGVYTAPICSRRAHELVQKGGAQLVDVREPDEYARGHLDGAINVPLSKLDDRVGEFKENQSVVIYCQSGLRAQRAIRVLSKAGVKSRMYNLGGMSRW